MGNLEERKQFQQKEKERLEYEGYCNKIRKGLEELDERSGERAIWELVQNARDMSDESRIKIELTDRSIMFSHHGKPFDYTSFRALVKQDSSKDRNDADLVGQYGTGFMTTHAFNRLVYVSGPFEVKSGKDITDGYTQINDFELDRTYVDTVDGPEKMREQLDIVENFCAGEVTREMKNDTTSFRYDLSSEQVDQVSIQLSNVIRLMPFVLVLNSRIKEIEIFNHKTGDHFTLQHDKLTNKTTIETEGWALIEEDITLTNHSTNMSTRSYRCKSLQSDKGDIVIIPPYPEACGKVSEIPSLFLWFPLLGTEDFGVNFIFHSKRFYPVEKRDNIMLPGSTFVKCEKGGANRLVLKEMTNALMSYFEKDENAKTLPREMCKVSFPQVNEDKETCAFYKEMQEIWNAHIPNWKVIPVAGEYCSISDNKVKLLHRDFYSQLTGEQKTSYEATIIKYALLPTTSEGAPYLMPTDDLIAWSETVDQWGCNRDNEFFITVADVCQAVKEKEDDLHTFLKLMKDSGNEKVMETYALLPNRDGKLHKKGELYHADFLTSEVYSLVKDLMGTDAMLVCDTSFLDICEFNAYSIDKLQDAILKTMNNWRNTALVDNKSLTDDQLSSLIRFCSVFDSSECNNVRSRMMPLLAEFYDKEYKIIPTIKFREEREEDFYKASYNFLLDYTLYLLRWKDSEWVKNNKEWLSKFLKEYSPSTNEEHKKRLDDYGILPNQKNKLCLMKDLRKNKGVPEEMAEIYYAIFHEDLHESWIDEDFEAILPALDCDTPKDIANKIENELVEDMKSEDKDSQVLKWVRQIIIKIEESKDWERWFGQINDKKAAYTFNMKSGEAQKSLFSLMDVDDDNLARLAKLSEAGDIELMLDKMERQQELECEREARFNHRHTIGKHIENVLRKRIGDDLVKVDDGADDEAMAEDVQDGQDIIVRVKKDEQWKDVFYVEVKSKWDFTEPAHMSARQIRRAVQNPDDYALCCVDLRSYKDKDIKSLPEDTIISCTRVKLDIGKKLEPMIQSILKADEQSDDVQIKISEYRSSIGAKMFAEGKPVGELLDVIARKIEAIR